MNCARVLALVISGSSIAACDLVLGIPERDVGPHLSCEDGVCTCQPPWGDCNATLADGCESDFSSSQVSCGGCNQFCNGGTCTEGTCVCASEFGDCDQDLSNGCETLLLTAREHCGACGRSCLDECADGACGAGLLSEVSPTGKLIAAPGGWLLTATRPLFEITAVSTNGGEETWVAPPMLPLDLSITASSMLTLGDDGYGYFYFQLTDTNLSGALPHVTVYRAPFTPDPATWPVTPEAVGSLPATLQPPPRTAILRGDDLFVPDQSGYGITHFPSAGGTPTLVGPNLAPSQNGDPIARIGDDIFTFDFTGIVRLGPEWPATTEELLIPANDLQSLHAVGGQLGALHQNGTVRFTSVEAPAWSAPSPSAWDLTALACPPIGAVGPLGLYLGFSIPDPSAACVPTGSIVAFDTAGADRPVYTGNGVSFAADAELLYLSLADGVYRFRP
jgi:hypothetical protein